MSPKSSIAFMIALALVAGCLDPPESDGPHGVPDPIRQQLAYRFTPSPPGGLDGGTIILAYSNGTIERLTYVDDHSAEVRVAPGIDYDAATFQLLLDPVAGGNLNRSTGGLLVKLERGRSDGPSFAELERLTKLDWPVTSPDSPGRIDYVRFTPTRDAQLVRTPPVPEGFQPIVDAFAALEAAFVPAFGQGAREPPSVADGACLDESISTSAQTLRARETLTVVSEVKNCGPERVTFTTDPCGSAPRLILAIAGPMALPDALPSRPGGEIRPMDRCQPEAEAFALDPGAQVTITRYWNGTRSGCVGDICTPHNATPGWYELYAFASWKESGSQTRVLVVGDHDPIAPVLLLKEYDWLNATAEAGRLIGDYGGHCAPASYTLDPPTLTVRTYERTPGQTEHVAPPAALVRDFRDSPPVDKTYTLSADKLDYDAGTNFTIASPFELVNTTIILAWARMEGHSFVVERAIEPIETIRLDPSESTILHFEYTFEFRGDTYDAAHQIVFTNVGKARVYFEEGGGCL